MGNRYTEGGFVYGWGVILIVVFLILFIAMMFYVSRSSKAFLKTFKQGAESPEGYVTITENAHIMEVQSTSMMINERPVMNVKIALSPAESPMLMLDTTRVFTYAELPQLIPNTSVRISYRMNPENLENEGVDSDAVLDLRVLGPAVIEWEGDPRVKAAANALVERMQGSKMLVGKGYITAAEKTGALLNGYPGYRYWVRFESTEGHLVEGETYQAARPWLERHYRNSSAVVVQYSATDQNDFILEKR